MRLELEWRIPWPADWTEEKKNQAAERLVSYMRDGTFYETERRMRVVNAAVKGTLMNKDGVSLRDPYVTLVLE